jgi:esterase
MEIQNGDVTLHVAVDGDEDAPPVLLLHGITQSVETWDWFVGDLIAYGYRVLRLDFRGHGRSGRAPGTYGFPAYVTDAAQVCLQVARQPCAIVGHSLGGGTAAGLAQVRPELVRAIVLEDAPLVPPDARGGNSLMTGFRLMRASIPQLQATGIPMEKLIEVLTRSPSPSGGTLGDLVHPDAIGAMAVGTMLLDASVLDPVLNGEMTSVYDPNEPVLVPTLALAADPSKPDAVTRPADLERLAASGAHVKTRTMVGSGHLIHDQLDQRDLFRDIVLDFLTRAAPA